MSDVPKFDQLQRFYLRLALGYLDGKFARAFRSESHPEIRKIRESELQDVRALLRLFGEE